MKKKQLVFRPTGEVRSVEDGEHYYNAGRMIYCHGYISYAYPIYKAVEEVIDVPLWRAEEEGTYFTIGAYQNIIEAHEDNYNEDDIRYKTANYFATRQEAERYAELMKFILSERLLNNPEFCKVIEKLKGELA